MKEIEKQIIEIECPECKGTGFNMLKDQFDLGTNCKHCKKGKQIMTLKEAIERLK